MRDIDEYNGLQHFNAVTAWLHSHRYKALSRAFERIVGDRAVRVVEIGCADAKAFDLLNTRFQIDYVGVEPSDMFIKRANEKYGERSNFRAVHGRIEDHLTLIEKGSVVLALEVLEHIRKTDVVRILEGIANARPAAFICSVPVEIGPAILLKNVGSFVAGYVRHEEYLWKETFWAGLGNLDRIRPHRRAHRGFNWRWLAKTIRHNMEIIETRRFPINFLPAAFNASVFFVARPRQRKLKRAP